MNMNMDLQYGENRNPHSNSHSHQRQEELLNEGQQQQQQQQHHQDDLEQIERIYAPSVTTHDVLMGRGGGTNRHNTHFRELVSDAQPQYVQARKKDKTRIAKSI